MDMSDAQDQRLLEALLDSWDRNNTILINLLRALPEGGLEARAMDGSPSVSEMFTHIHHERMVSVFENAPEFAGNPIVILWIRTGKPEAVKEPNPRGDIWLIPESSLKTLNRGGKGRPKKATKKGAK